MPRILRNRQQADIPTPSAVPPTPDGFAPLPRDIQRNGTEGLGIRPASPANPELACRSCRRYKPVVIAAGFCTVHDMAVGSSEVCRQYRIEARGRENRRLRDDQAALRAWMNSDVDEALANLRNSSPSFTEQVLERIGATPPRDTDIDDALDPSFVNPIPRPASPDRFRDRWLREREASRQREADRNRIRQAGACSNCAFSEADVGRLTCVNPNNLEFNVTPEYHCGYWEPRDAADRQILGLPEQPAEQED